MLKYFTVNQWVSYFCTTRFPTQAVSRGLHVYPLWTNSRLWLHKFWLLWVGVPCPVQTDDPRLLGKPLPTGMQSKKVNNWKEALQKYLKLETKYVLVDGEDTYAGCSVHVALSSIIHHVLVCFEYRDEPCHCQQNHWKSLSVSCFCRELCCHMS